MKDSLESGEAHFRLGKGNLRRVGYELNGDTGAVKPPFTRLLLLAIMILFAMSLMHFRLALFHHLVVLRQLLAIEHG
ncbi:hypothetical protein GCM10022278_35400 [Allohahella marinimesophila]|uniref:Uncharacterized protein n=1 Tax=Allohahella marinimesophila TaxID=1054972 RepID=A0ABP7Q2H7_9GAMM